MNYPDRGDYYQMMNACQIVRVNSKSPASVQPKHFQLSFNGDNVTQSKEERDRCSRAAMNARIAARGGIDKYYDYDIRYGNGRNYYCSRSKRTSI